MKNISFDKNILYIGDKNIVFALVDFRDLNASYSTSALITIPAPPP